MPEYDAAVRTAKVSILLRYIDFLDYWDALGDLSGFVTNIDCRQHWAVVFEFDNRGSIVYEAVQMKNDEEQSLIVPQWRWSYGLTCGLFSRMQELGEVATSPAAIREFASTVSSNYQEYSPLNTNCQEWAKELLAIVDPNLRAALHSYNIKSVKERLSLAESSNSYRLWCAQKFLLDSYIEEQN